MTRVRMRCLAAVLSLFATTGALSADDSSSIAALLDEAERIEKSDRARATLLVQQASRGLERVSDLPTRIRYFLHRCELSPPNASALDAAKQGLALASKTNDLQSSTRLTLCRASVLSSMGQTSESLAALDEALAMATRGGNRLSQADALAQRAYLRYYLGTTADALVDAQRAYDLYQSLQLEDKRREALTLLAHIYAEPQVARYGRAVEYYDTVLRAYEKNGAEGDVADTLFNLGATYTKMGQFSQALTHMRRAHSIFARLGKRSDTAYAQRELGAILKKSGRPAEAIPWFDRALEYFRSEQDQEGTAATLQARGAALRLIGRNADAIRDLEASRAYFEKEKSIRYLERLYDDLAAVYAASGRSSEALAAKQKQLDVQKQIYDTQREETTSRLRVEFDTARRDEENRALARENALRAAALAAAQREQRLQWIVIALTALLAAALAGLFWRQRALAERMRWMAMTDELTRLPNRRRTLAAAEEAFALARHDRQPLSLIAIDVDHFKQINDAHGHAGGDAVLRRVAHGCRVALRPNDVIGRVGGEEFLVILPNTRELDAVKLAERLRTAVESMQIDDVATQLTATVSLGVVCSERGESLSALIRTADQLLYRAKESGRNRVVSAHS